MCRLKRYPFALTSRSMRATAFPPYLRYSSLQSATIFAVSGSRPLSSEIKFLSSELWDPFCRLPFAFGLASLCLCSFCVFMSCVLRLCLCVLPGLPSLQRRGGRRGVGFSVDGFCRLGV